MLTESQINKFVNFFQIVEGVIGEYWLRGYDRETILNSDGLCPICDRKLEEYEMYGTHHELRFDFFLGTWECEYDRTKSDSGNIIDFIVKVKKISREEAVAWVNNYIKR